MVNEVARGAPVFGDSEWIRRARGDWQDLPGDAVVTVRDALYAGLCQSGVESFMRSHFRDANGMVRKQVFVSELIGYLSSYDEIEQVLFLVWERWVAGHRCTFCSRIDEHAKWCWEAA